jgi:peptidyl-dipeptidase Dcp
VRAGAAAGAEGRGFKGKWLIANTRSSVEPFLAYFDASRSAREKIWRTFVDRGGDDGDAHDNNAIIAEILQLRSRRAKLLGFPTHAHWRLQDSMARRPERATELMEAVWNPRSRGCTKKSPTCRRSPTKRKATGIRIEPWDYRHYAEKVRVAKYALDNNELKPYLQLEKLREGMFYVAGRTVRFALRSVAAGHGTRLPPGRTRLESHRHRGKIGRPVVLRSVCAVGKQWGAWMNAYSQPRAIRRRDRHHRVQQCELREGQAGRAAVDQLGRCDHAVPRVRPCLHGLSSNVTYPTVSGTNVPRDYVEFPSQLLEHWLSTPEVLDRYARALSNRQADPGASWSPTCDRAETFDRGLQDRRVPLAVRRWWT